MAKKFYIEHCVTLYHIDVFEADSIEEAREMRDHTTFEYEKHLDDVFVGHEVDMDDMQYRDYSGMGELDWHWDGPVLSKEEFMREYTSL